MLFERDPILRQIKQLADMVAAIAGASSAVPEGEDMEQALADAYLGLLGLDVPFADSLEVDALLGMLHDEGQRRALVELLLAHGDMLAARGDEGGARRRWERARQVLLVSPDAELAKELADREA